MVRVFSGAGAMLQAFFAYDPASQVEANVAVGDVDGDGRADLVTVPGAGSPAHVRVFAGSTLVRAFIAGNPSSKLGASVAAGAGQIVLGSGSTVRVIDGQTLATRALFMPFGLTPTGLEVALGR